MGFNPRTRMGCDLERKYGSVEHEGFNPRTRMGCDSAFYAPPADGYVSIHAPAWGATTKTMGIKTLATSFNPRTRMGCDLPA